MQGSKKLVFFRIIWLLFSKTDNPIIKLNDEGFLSTAVRAFISVWAAMWLPATIIFVGDKIHYQHQG